MINRDPILKKSSYISVFLFKITLTIIVTFSLISNTKGTELDSLNQEIVEAPLFASEEPIKITLTIDIRTVRNDNSDDPQYSEGNLVLYNSPEDSITLDIEVKARGHARRLYGFCTFPPIKLNFKKKQVEGTVFEGQDKLKLVSYCKDMESYEDYVLQEYLIYKMYNMFTPYSFKVRLVEVTYKDIKDKANEVVRYGFLIEDDERMAERNGGTITEVLMSNHDRCERETLDIFTIFEFMIGNADWWIAKPVMHNVKLVYFEGKPIVPVPYDFDYCGAINTSYAVPPEVLDLSSVRIRYFMGFCRLQGTYENTITLFNDKKDAIYDMYNNFELLDEKKIKSVLKYYDDFYEIVNDPKKLKINVYDKCQIQHRHLHDVKKLK